MDAGRRVFGQIREPVVVDLGLHQSGPHVVGDAVARHVLVRTGHPVARDRAEHDARVHLTQVLEAEAALREPARTHRLDDDVGAPHEVEIDVNAFLCAQVENERTLAAVDVQMHQRHALDDGPCHLPDVVARRRLDLDDFGAEVGEVGRDRCRTQHRALDDAQAGEGRLSHG